MLPKARVAHRVDKASRVPLHVMQRRTLRSCSHVVARIALGLFDDAIDATRLLMLRTDLVGGLTVLTKEISGERAGVGVMPQNDSGRFNYKSRSRHAAHERRVSDQHNRFFLCELLQRPRDVVADRRSGFRERLTQ